MIFNHETKFIKSRCYVLIEIGEFELGLIFERLAYISGSCLGHLVAWDLCWVYSGLGKLFGQSYSFLSWNLCLKRLSMEKLYLCEIAIVEVF